MLRVEMQQVRTGILCGKSKEKESRIRHGARFTYACAIVFCSHSTSIFALTNQHQARHSTQALRSPSQLPYENARFTHDTQFPNTFTFRIASRLHIQRSLVLQVDGQPGERDAHDAQVGARHSLHFHATAH